LDAEQQDRSLRVVLPRLAHVHVFHWLPGDPIERRPLSEGETPWRGWFATMHAAGIRPDSLLEFVPGDDPEILSREAAVVRRLMA
jgi:sugar phosphate isomerase/epimerase